MPIKPRTRKLWLLLLGVLPLLPQVAKGIVWLLDWQGRIETAISNFRDGRVGDVIEFLLNLLFNPAPWTIWPGLLFGFGLIWFAVYRSTKYQRASKARTHPIVTSVHRESPRLREISNEFRLSPVLWDNTFYLVLENKDPNRTVRNASVQINALESIERCPVKGTSTFTSDIRHGDFVYFRLGRVVSTEFSGLPGGGLAGEPVTAEEMRGYEQRTKSGFLSFEPASGAMKFSGRIDAAGLAAKWTFPVIITGDDLPAKTVAVSIDMRPQKVSAIVDETVSPNGVSCEH